MATKDDKRIPNGRDIGKRYSCQIVHLESVLWNRLPQPPPLLAHLSPHDNIVKIVTKRVKQHLCEIRKVSITVLREQLKGQMAEIEGLLFSANMNQQTIGSGLRPQGCNPSFQLTRDCCLHPPIDPHIPECGCFLPFAIHNGDKQVDVSCRDAITRKEEEDPFSGL